MRLQEFITEDWNKVNHHDKTDGLSQKAVNAYRRENPGSKLQTAVTTKPSKLKAGSKDAKRRKSFCARMSGNKGPMKDEKGRPTPKAKALRRWNCESIEEMRQLIEHAEREIIEEKIKQRLDPKCWKGKHKEGTKIKGGVRVNNCVPNNEGYQSVERTDKDDPYGLGGKHGTPMQIDIGAGGASKSSPGAQSGNGLTKLASKLSTSGTKATTKTIDKLGSAKMPNESVESTIVAAGASARRAVDTALNAIPRPFDEKEVAKDLKNQGSAQKAAVKKNANASK